MAFPFKWLVRDIRRAVYDYFHPFNPLYIQQPYPAELEFRVRHRGHELMLRESETGIGTAAEIRCIDCGGGYLNVTDYTAW